MDQTNTTQCGKCQALGVLAPCDACYYGRHQQGIERPAPCHDCGSTYHRTGTYHCPEVSKGDE